MNVQQEHRTAEANVEITLGVDQTRSINIAPGGVGIHALNGIYVSWTTQEAIEAAKAILQYHHVPFCNRVKGAGRA